MKKAVEHRIDGRFVNIGQFENHISDLAREIDPRGIYDALCKEFNAMLRARDYNGILKVYNRKTMISESHVARLCGLRHDSKDAYIGAVIDTLRRDLPEADTIRHAVKAVFGIES